MIGRPASAFIREAHYWMLEFIKMDIILSKERVDAQECDLLVVGFFRDERPLRGSSGWIDWRFNGMLSQLLVENKLTGDWKEATLIPSQERILPKMVLLLGLGEVKAYGALRLRQLSPYLLDTLRKLRWPSICLSFPHGESYHVDGRKIVESLVEGIAYVKQNRKESIDVVKKKLRLGPAQERNLERAIDLLINKYYENLPYPSLRGVETVLGFIEKDNPKAKTADPKSFIDDSLLREIEQSGFVKTLYAK